METPSSAPASTIRLLVAERTENDAYALDSLLRANGIVTRLRFIDDLSLAVDHVSSADLMLINSGLPDAAEAIPAIKRINNRLPIIALRSDEQPADLSFASPDAAMQHGACDLVHREHQTHLLRACQREIESQCLTARLVQNKRALSEAEQRCQLLLQGAEAAIAYVHEGMHIYANDAYLKLFGFADAEDLIGLPLIDLVADASVEQLRGELKAFRAADKRDDFDVVALNGDGNEFSCSVSLAAAQYEGEGCIQVTLRFDNPSANSAANGNGSATALPIPPRHGIGDFLHEVEGATRNANHASRAMFLVGVDDAAVLRSTFGLQGAELVCDRIELMLSTLSEGMPCLRINPDLFAIYLFGSTLEDLRKQANEYRSAVEELLLEVNEKTVRASIHMIGVEEVDREATDQLLERAYRTYIEVGEHTSNSIEIHTRNTPDVKDDEATRVMKLVNEAIEKQKFMLLFQPIISLRGDNDEHYEVFLRMLDRNGEQMVPHQFLETAIANNVAGKIDRWVILQSIKMLSVHRAKGHSTRLTINISANSIADPEFLQWLSVAIKAARLPSDAVIFQLTENDAHTYLRQSREFVEGLKKLHCRSSLSRFGLLNDPFETLSHLPVDMVKLDGSIVSNDSGTEYLNTVIKKLQSKGKLTVVPMVENAGMLSALWQAGANYIQGHYLQEPVAEMSYDFSTDE
ncbi:MAG: EAL domain-containing protein [Pseudomonadota bacterium]